MFKGAHIFSNRLCKFPTNSPTTRLIDHPCWALCLKMIKSATRDHFSNVNIHLTSLATWSKSIIQIFGRWSIVCRETCKSGLILQHKCLVTLSTIWLINTIFCMLVACRVSLHWLWVSTMASTLSVKSTSFTNPPFSSVKSLGELYSPLTMYGQITSSNKGRNMFVWKCNEGRFTGLHTQKVYTHTGTSSPQILMLSAHAYVHFVWELQLDKCNTCNTVRGQIQIWAHSVQ